MYEPFRTIEFSSCLLLMLLMLLIVQIIGIVPIRNSSFVFRTIFVICHCKSVLAQYSEYVSSSSQTNSNLESTQANNQEAGHSQYCFFNRCIYNGCSFPLLHRFFRSCNARAKNAPFLDRFGLMRIPVGLSCITIDLIILFLFWWGILLPLKQCVTHSRPKLI